MHPIAAPAVLDTPEQAIIGDARRLCAAGDCEAAQAKLDSLIPDTSRWRDSPEFKEVESSWAQSVIDHAEGVTDIAPKRALYQRVAQNMNVDAVHRKIAADKLQQLDSAGAASANALELPVASATGAAKPRAEEGASVASHAEPVHRGTPAAAQEVMPSPAPAGTKVEDRERELALQGTPDSKLALKQQLETRVYSGKASEAEIRLLISTCKDLGDRSCVQQARSVLAQRGQ